MKFNSVKNNKGETLVEIIVGVLLLAIASVSLVKGFVATAKIVNRADLLKNASAASSSSLELKDSYDVNFDEVNVDKVESKQRNVKISGRKPDGAHFNISVAGDLITAKEQGQTGLTYREFVPGLAGEFNSP